MVMMAEARSRLAALWRRIEDAHYSYLETDDSPEKLLQRKKLDGYITEYLSIVPHECKFGLAQTGKVFARTIAELPEFSSYRAGLGWAALARYASNLLAQPWRKEYKVIRLYCGYYKHEVEANMVGAETLLHAMGYKPAGAGRLELTAPVCPDTVAAMSRDAVIAETECQIMAQIWESVWNSGARVSWAAVAAERTAHVGDAASAAARLLAIARHRTNNLMDNGSEIYSNIPVAVTEMQQYSSSQPYDSRYNNHSMATSAYDQTPIEEPITPMIHPQYVMAPNVIPPHMMYPVPQQMPEVTVPQVVMPPYAVPYGVPYYPMQAPYMIPTPVYTPIKQATNVPINGYPQMPQCRYPAVPTGQLIEFDSPSVYENGKYEDRQRKRGETSRRNSTSRSGFSEVSLPSLPRSDTQPSLSKAREDGMGTYESWDYVFRNLSSKDEVAGERSRYSPSLDRDSRTLDRLDKEERRARYQPTTLDLEDGLQALNLDRTYDDDQYRTAKVNENLMRLKLEQEQKRARHVRRAKEAEERRKLESVPNPNSDALIPTKVAPDKVKLLTKKEIKERKDVIKQQNGNVPSAAEARKVKKPAKLVTELDRARKPVENGHAQASVARNGIGTSPNQSYDIKAQLVVSLDDPDCSRRSPKQNGDRSPSRNHETRPFANDTRSNSASKWECGTCTYLNKNSLQACEMCGKSKKGPEIQPLTSGGRECPACTLVNQRDATICDACGTSLEHCPTYI